MVGQSRAIAGVERRMYLLELDERTVETRSHADVVEAGKKLAQEPRPDADFSSAKGDRDNADSSKNA